MPPSGLGQLPVMNTPLSSCGTEIECFVAVVAGGWAGGWGFLTGGTLTGHVCTGRSSGAEGANR